jgi:hypothetical protein
MRSKAMLAPTGARAFGPGSAPLSAAECAKRIAGMQDAATTWECKYNGGSSSSSNQIWRACSMWHSCKRCYGSWSVPTRTLSSRMGMDIKEELKIYYCFHLILYMPE